MSAGEYAGGFGSACLVVLALAVTAVRMRRILLPLWSGAPALVADAVIAIAALVLVAELLGAAGLFERGPLLAVLGALAAGAFALRRRHGAGTGAPPRAERTGAAAAAGAALTVGIVLVPWLQYAFSAFHDGMREFDTVSYHLPFAARFVQDASTTGLLFDGNPPVAFYPANSELIHAVGMLAFHRDLISPVLNVAWLGLALLAGWCLGSPRGVAPATMAAVALVAAPQVMVSSQAGTAKNDIVALALLLSAAALLVNAPRSRGARLLAALAGGLAVGTRLNLWAPVLALAAVAIAWTAAGHRRRATAALLLGGFAGGGFWYIRNLVAVGNPFPWLDVLGLPATTPPIDCGTTTVAHYLTDPGFIRAHLLPQIAESMGGRWWLLALLALAGIGAGLVRASAPAARALALVALVSGTAYLVTPATAGGADAGCFGFNTRFAIPALALALVALPIALRSRGVPALPIVAAYLVALIADVRIEWKPAPALASIALVAGATLLALGRRRRLPRPLLAAALAAALALAAFAGWREQSTYFRDRYTKPNLVYPVEDIAARLAGASGARIAVAGLSETYPLYGRDLSHRVELPAARHGGRFVRPVTCTKWLAALRRGRYDYVVTARRGSRPSPAAIWTRLYPGAREILSSEPGFARRGVRWHWQLFRIERARSFDPEAACS